MTFKGLSLAVLSAFALVSTPLQPSLASGKIVQGFVSHGALQWPEYVAKQFGWFKENGIEVEMITVGGGAAQQLAAGSINIGYSGFPDFIRAANSGAPIKIIINGIGVPPYRIYAKSSIKKIGDLKGKVVSIGAAKDITTIYLSAFIEPSGLKIANLDLVYAKATPSRFAALVSGGVDAAILFPPFTFRAGAQGFTNLGEIEPYLPGYPFTVWAVNTNWAKNNGDKIRAYVKTYGRAIRWLYDTRNKDEAVKILMKNTKSAEKDSADTYDYFIKLGAFSKDGKVSPSVYKKMSEGLVWLGDLSEPVPPMTNFFDTSYVDAAWGK